MKKSHGAAGAEFFKWSFPSNLPPVGRVVTGFRKLIRLHPRGALPRHAAPLPTPLVSEVPGAGHWVHRDRPRQAMAAGPVGVTHPAKTMFLMAFILAFLAWILNMIAVFVPWSWRDVAVYNRWWVSLWQNCLRITNAWLHDITCYRNDVNQVGSVAAIITLSAFR